MRNQRRIGEALMLASGIGVAAAGASLGVMPLEDWLLLDSQYFQRFGIGDTSIYQTLRNLRRQRTF